MVRISVMLLRHLRRRLSQLGTTTRAQLTETDKEATTQGNYDYSLEFINAVLKGEYFDSGTHSLVLTSFYSGCKQRHLTTGWIVALFQEDGFKLINY